MDACREFAWHARTYTHTEADKSMLCYAGKPDAVIEQDGKWRVLSLLNH